MKTFENLMHQHKCKLYHLLLDWTSCTHRTFLAPNTTFGLIFKLLHSSIYGSAITDGQLSPTVRKTREVKQTGHRASVVLAHMRERNIAKSSVKKGQWHNKNKSKLRYVLHKADCQPHSHTALGAMKHMAVTTSCYGWLITYSCM